jgi:PAB-dependent poly(A)-specific ribonuclease subunit 3
MSDTLREELQKRNEDVVQVADAHILESLKLPNEVHTYHSLCPIEAQSALGRMSKVYGHPTSTYKAISTTDGRTYMLRRVEGMES